MLFNKINKIFDIETVVLSLDFRPLVIVKKPHEEIYPFWQLLLVNRGQMSIIRDGKEEIVTEGQMILRQPDKASTMIYPDNGELYMGLIDFFCPNEELYFFTNGAITLTPKERSIISNIIKEASLLFEEFKTDTLWPELISSELEAFLLRVYGRLKGILPTAQNGEKINSKNNISSTVNKINSILEERRFSNVSIEEIALILNESPNVIMKRYKKEMHESIMMHFLNLKLQTAIQFIISSNMNFTEISELLGFSSVNYFSKFFKKRTGMTPTEYSRSYYVEQYK